MLERKTKIIATIGPSSLDKNVFIQMVNEGVDFVRMNMAYSNSDQIKTLKNNIDLSGKTIPIIFDIRSAEVSNLSEFGKVDYIALSFTETSKQIQQVLKNNPDTKVISKIETQKGLDNFEDILSASWGVMIARGDLGKSIHLEKVPCAQKHLSGLVKKQGNFLIIATEMLLSMVENEHPTRAEVSDVANAIFEGADGVMLSEESAIGKNPIKAVAYMRRIIQETETCVGKNL